MCETPLLRGACTRGRKAVYPLMNGYPGWHLSCEDQRAALFLPQGSPWEDKLARQKIDDVVPPTEAPLCFP